MRTIFIALIMLVVQLRLAVADVVVLKNGDRVTGRIEVLSAGKLTLATDYAGKIKIDWKKVASLSTADRVIVEFVGGKSAIGIIDSPTAEALAVKSMSMPPLLVSRAEVAAIKQDPTLVEKPGLLHRWHGHTDVGYSVRVGNTRLNTLTLNFEPERRTESNQIRVKLQSLTNVQNKLTSSRLYKGRIRYDHFVGRRMFIFGVSQMEKDERKFLDLRVSEGGGFGIRLRPGPETRLSFFGGATFFQEQVKTKAGKLGSEALAGMEVETRNLSPFVISVKSQILPIISEDRYRVEWDANIRLPIFQGFAVGLQLFNYFDSRPPREDVRRNDFGLLSTLGLVF